MTIINATNGQLELGFNGVAVCPKITRRESRIARANWRFAKMREAVSSTMDWETIGTPRPEQIWMPGTHREVKL